jgi:biopolymer transport protein ExbD
VRIDDESASEEPGINMTPMIDVVFQLLIFFMLATTYIDPEKVLDLKLPEAESGAEPLTQNDEIIINVLRDGRFVLSGQELGKDALSDALKRAAQRSRETPVTIRGDRLVHHEAIVSVMDACGIAGLVNLSVGTLDGG